MEGMKSIGTPPSRALAETAGLRHPSVARSRPASVLPPHRAVIHDAEALQMKPTILVRPARSDDLSAVRDLLVTTWHDAYDALIGARKVTEITDSWHSVENLARQLAVPDTSFLVVEAEASIVGHAFANAQRPPVLLLTRLYVRPDRPRRGIGARLLAQ